MDGKRIETRDRCSTTDVASTAEEGDPARRPCPDLFVGERIEVSGAGLRSANRHVVPLGRRKRRPDERATGRTVTDGTMHGIVRRASASPDKRITEPT